MSEKSYVTMERRVCVVCAQAYETGALLMSQRMLKRFNEFTTTGWGMCPEHQKLADDGYVALIEIDADRSDSPPTVDGAYRLGHVAHVRRSAWAELFNGEPPEHGVTFVDTETLDTLRGMASHAH